MPIAGDGGWSSQSPVLPQLDILYTIGEELVSPEIEAGVSSPIKELNGVKQCILNICSSVHAQKKKDVPRVPGEVLRTGSAGGAANLELINVTLSHTSYTHPLCL
jgi:hypothetical protein